jgi:hypothetical protein
VAEYAFEKPASLPKWTLPESTELMVTDQRVLYAHTVSDQPGDDEIISGELRWLWPQHLRVQPGARESGRSAATTQIQLVCGGSDGSWPALVFAGGDLRTAADADRVANLIRQSVARFRVDNSAKLGLTIAQSRLLSRLLIGPEFSNYLGGPGETVSIPGALLVNRTAVDPYGTPAYQPAARQPAYGPSVSPLVPVTAALTAPAPAPVSPAPVSPAPVSHRAPEPVDVPIALPVEIAALPSVARLDDGLPSAGAPPRPAGEAGRPAREIARPAREITRPAREVARTTRDVPRLAEPPARLVGEGATRVISVRPGIAADMARALQAAKAEAATQESEPDLASRAADLAARVASLVSEVVPSPTVRVDLAAADRFDDGPTTNLSERAETVRRAAARFAANSARTRVILPRDAGSTSRGNRTP